jgi:hypothetical protein
VAAGTGFSGRGSRGGGFGRHAGCGRGTAYVMRMRSSRVREARGRLRDDEPVRGGPGERPGGPGRQWRREEQDRGQRHEGSGSGFWTHMNFGGAEAPEQLLTYPERRHGVSDHAGSVYRSVNVIRDRLIWRDSCIGRAEKNVYLSGSGRKFKRKAFGAITGFT